MTNVRTRLEKLERANKATEAKVGLIILTALGKTEPPIGYSCGEMTFIRQPGESQEMLKDRCSQSVTRDNYGLIPILATLYEH